MGREVDVRAVERRAVLVGGAMGTALRLGAGELLPGGVTWPWPTFVVNVTGALVLGLFVTTAPTPRAQALLATGLLGSYTTFSAFAAESRALLAAGRPGVAAAYVFASTGLGYAAAVLGGHLGRRRGHRSPA